MRGLAMIDGCVRLTTRFAVGQRNRTAMEETAIFLGAFSDSKTAYTSLYRRWSATKKDRNLSEAG